MYIKHMDNDNTPPDVNPENLQSPEQEVSPVPLSQKNPTKQWFLYSITIIGLITVIIVVIIFLNASKDGEVNGNRTQDNQLAQEEKLPVETSLMNRLIQFTDSAPNGVYKLVTNSGETNLQVDQLLTTGGFYFQNRGTGELYNLISYDDYSNQSTINTPLLKLKKIEDVNYNNFYVYQKDTRYATDLKNVYYIEWTPTGFTSSLNYRYSVQSDYNYTLQILRGADLKTFEPNIVTTFPISQGNGFQGLYSRDIKTVFYGSEALEGVDAPTFKLSEDVSITSDKNRVYLWNKIIPLADPETYIIIFDGSADGRGTVYGKDKNNVFVDYCLLTGIDPNSFSINWNRDPTEYADKQGVFNIDLQKNKERIVESCIVVR